jgi:hypothetical protein
LLVVQQLNDMGIVVAGVVDSRRNLVGVYVFNQHESGSKWVVGYFEAHEVEPPHPVCDMKPGGEWEGVVEEIDNETPEIRDFIEKKSQRQ